MNKENLQNRSVCLVSISGAGHSGTTLLASMIGNHPEVHLITYETGWFLDSQESNEGAFNYLRKFTNENSRATVIVEKTPKHVFHTDKIKKYWPETRF
jgi:protein O-GlcNAc transferase